MFSLFISARIYGTINTAFLISFNVFTLFIFLLSICKDQTLNSFSNQNTLLTWIWTHFHPWISLNVFKPKSQDVKSRSSSNLTKPIKDVFFSYEYMSISLRWENNKRQKADSSDGENIFTFTVNIHIIFKCNEYCMKIINMISLKSQTFEMLISLKERSDNKHQTGWFKLIIES